MSVQVIDNFSYKGKKGNFERDKFDTLQAMRSYPEDGIDDGHVCFCNEDGNHYKFNHLNSVDGATGRWRLHNKSVNTLTETGEGKVLDARQGKILKDLIDAKVIEAGGVSFDTVPTKGSTNPVTSNGIKEAMDEQAESINSNTGVADYPTFSASTAYSQGKVVNYNGKLYKFTADHAAGAWIGTDVEETSMADNSKTAKVKLEDLDTLFTGSQSAGTAGTAAEIMTGLVPTVYDVMGSQNVILGKLFAYSDSMRHVITQVLFTSMTLDDNGGLIDTHNDGITHMYYRTYGVMAPSLTNGKWTEWKQIVTELDGGTYMQTLEPGDTPITSLNNFNRCENHIYFASTPGTYTKAGNIVVENGELVLILWSWRTKAFSKKTIYKTNIVQETGYVTCPTAAGTAAKTVAKTNFALSTGCRLIVKMTNYNTASSPTLDINNTGAKPLYYNGEIASADNSWDDGEVLDIYYDGTNYQAYDMQGGDDKKLNELSEDVEFLKNTVGFSSGEETNLSSQFIFTPDGLIPGYNSGDYKTGIVSSNSKYSYSDYVDISAFSYLKIKCIHLTIESTAGLCFYNSSKSVIKGYTFNNNISNSNNLEEETIEIPYGAKYIRTTIFKNGESDFSCFGGVNHGLIKDVSTLKEETEKLNQEVSALNKGIVLSSLYENDDFTNGYIETVPAIDGTPLSLTVHANSDWRCKIIDIIGSKYDFIVVSGLGGEAARLFCFVNSDNVVISQSESLHVAAKEKISIPEGSSKIVFNSRPKGYNTTAIYEPKISLFNDNADGLVDLLGVESAEGDVLGVIDCPETDIIKTYKNYVLREVIEGETRKFFYSKDSGATFTESENTLGLITYLAWFSTGRAIIATSTKCYYTDDFKSFTESNVLDYNGEKFIPNSVHFGDLTACFHDETFIANGKEGMFWVDYGGPSGYIPRAWFTNDYGVTVKCVLKNNETMIDEQLFSIRHFHASAWDPFDNCIWINTGDHTNECYIIKGVLQEDDNWKFTIVQRGSDNDKYGGMIVNKLHVDMISDFTGGRNTGILRMAKLQPEKSFEYVYNSGGKQPISNYFFDSVGNRILLHPTEVIGKMLYAKRDLNFKQCTVRFNGATKIPFYLSNNYNGTVVVVGFPSNWNPITDIYLNSQKRYLLSEGFIKGGVSDFGKIEIKDTFNY